MITNLERISRLIMLCNKFKDRVMFYNHNYFYKYANLCWLLAFDTWIDNQHELPEVELIYEDAGDNPYYDLLGIQVGDEYACIPVPLVVNTIVSYYVKKASVVEKVNHSRQTPISDVGLLWEDLSPELTFLCLRETRDEYYTLRNVEGLGLGLLNPTLLHDLIPKNPIAYDKRGGSFTPTHDETFFMEYTYQGVKFFSWKILKGMFTSSVPTKKEE